MQVQIGLHNEYNIHTIRCNRLLPSQLANKCHCERLSLSDEGRQNMQTYTAHFVAPKPYVPLQHILLPGVKLCMEATKCAANVDTICRRRQIVQGRQNVPQQGASNKKRLY